MPTQTPRRPQPQEKRHLHVAEDPRSARANRDPRRAVRGLVGAGAAVVMLALGATHYVTSVGEIPKDGRTEQNDAKERNMLAPLFAKPGESVQLPYKAAEVEINQFHGKVSIEISQTGSEFHPVTLKLRKGPFRQRDLDNDKIEDSNALIELGDPFAKDERVRNATKVTFDGALTATFANGDQWVGGIPMFEGDEIPNMAEMSAKEFSDLVVWANVSRLDQPSSGAIVNWEAASAVDQGVNGTPDLSVLSGPSSFSGVPTAQIK